jgi:hypothetical protein
MERQEASWDSPDTKLVDAVNGEKKLFGRRSELA